MIRLRSMGDSILTTPALALLKSYRPDLRLAVVVEDRFAQLFEGNPDVDAVLSPASRSLRQWRPELCLNFHGGTRSVVLGLLSGARYRVGWAHHRWSMFHNVSIPRAQEILGVSRKVHTAEHLASAMFFLGVPLAQIPRARLFAGSPPELPPYAAIHPFAAAADKTWPAERFVAVAAHLRREMRLEPVFVAGPGDDTAPFRDYRIVARAPLAEIKCLLKGASLFVGNDSGPAHIAAAFGTPVVALFGPSDPVVWAPWNTESQVLVGRDGIHDIRVEQVLAALEKWKVRA